MSEKQKKYAVVYTWPGSNVNAESEVIKRMLIAAKNINMQLDVVSKEGYILDKDMFKTSTRIHDNEYEFMMTIHYDDMKLWDSFYYHMLWNPPLIPLQYNCYTDIQKKIISNDDFLIYDDGGISNHLRVMCKDTPRNIDNASFFSASFPKTLAQEPELKNPCLFYCGTNWEKFVGAKPRHDGLFKSLDKLDYVKIFGPNHAWKGYKRYMGSVPFDGVSLVKEMHKCGIVLALSSDAHFRAGAASNRVYEGSVAGAVIISDRNAFITKHFGDSILYFDYDKENPQNMFKQIKKHVDWVRANPDKAIKLAQKSQKIFLEKFTLEKQLTDIINNHENRKKAVADALYSKDKKKKTLAVCFIDTPDFSEKSKSILTNTISNIEKQIDKNIVLAICCDRKIINNVKTHIDSLNPKSEIILKPFDIFDDCNYKWLSRGQMLLDVIKGIKHDYLCILDGQEIMFSDHITTLKRTLEDNHDKIAAYAGTFLNSKDGNRYWCLNKNICDADIYNCIYQNNMSAVSGNFLLRKDIELYFDKNIAEYIDGCEVSAMLNLALFKHNNKIIYSKRTTCGCDENLIYDFPQTIKFNEQKNLIHGLVLFDYQESNNNDYFNIYYREQILRIIKIKMLINIFLVKLRNKIIISPKHRKKNKIRIDYYNSKIHEINQALSNIV